MKFANVIMVCPLLLQEKNTPEGYQRAICLMPRNSQILYLGVNPPNDEIGLTVVTRVELDAENKILPAKPNEMAQIEFVVLTPGMAIADGLVLRAPVKTPQGMIFLFEKKSAPTLIVPGGRG